MDVSLGPTQPDRRETQRELDRSRFNVELKKEIVWTGTVKKEMSNMDRK